MLRPETAELTRALLRNLHVVIDATYPVPGGQRFVERVGWVATDIQTTLNDTMPYPAPYPLARDTPTAKTEPRCSVLSYIHHSCRRVSDLDVGPLVDAFFFDAHGCPRDGSNPIVPRFSDAYQNACCRFVDLFEIILWEIRDLGHVNYEWIQPYRAAALSVDLASRLGPLNNSRPSYSEATEGYRIASMNLLRDLTRRKAELAFATPNAPSPPPPDLAICQAVQALAKAHYDIVRSAYPHPLKVDRAAADFFASPLALSFQGPASPRALLQARQIFPSCSSIAGTNPDLLSPAYPILFALRDAAAKGDESARAALATATPLALDFEYISSIPAGLHMADVYLTSAWARSSMDLCKADGKWGAHAQYLTPDIFPATDPCFLTFFTAYMFPSVAMKALTTPRRPTAPSCRLPFLSEPVPDIVGAPLPSVACEHPYLPIAARYTLVLNPRGSFFKPPAGAPQPPYPVLGEGAHPPDTDAWRRLIRELGNGDPSFAFIVEPLAKVASFIETRRVPPAPVGLPPVGAVPLLQAFASNQVKREPGSNSFRREPGSSSAPRVKREPGCSSSSSAPASGPEPPHSTTTWDCYILTLVIETLRNKIGNSTFTAEHLLETLDFFHAHLVAVEAEPRRPSSEASYAGHMVRLRPAAAQMLVQPSFRQALFRAIEADAGVSQSAAAQQQASLVAAMHEAIRSAAVLDPDTRIRFAQAAADVLFNFDQRVVQYYDDIRVQNPSLKPGGGVFKELQAKLDVSSAAPLSLDRFLCCPHHTHTHHRSPSRSPSTACPSPTSGSRVSSSPSSTRTGARSTSWPRPSSGAATRASAPRASSPGRPTEPTSSPTLH